MWVKPEYVGGRLEEGTKVWTCCGCKDGLSVYCASQQVREEWWRTCEKEEDERAKAKARMEEAAVRR